MMTLSPSRFLQIAFSLSFGLLSGFTLTPAYAVPTVSLTAPLNGATYTAPAAITLNATAADPNGISTVEFYRGEMLLGTDTTSPYTWALSNVAAGSYNYRAMAYNSLGESTLSPASTVTVTAANPPPTVSLTAPLNGAIFTAPAAITLSATATDSNGITKVEFYQGAVLLGTDTVAPYSWALSNVAVGTYNYTAKAYDSLAASTVSAAASVTVKAANTPPTVSLTAPLNGATYIAPAAITLSANAADSNGITKVEFYQGAVLLGTDTTSPYTWALSNVAIGTYSYTAKAYDSLAASAVSAAASITVGAPASSTLLNWSLNDGSGSIAYDSSGRGNHGALSGGATWVPGKIGGGLNLDGVSGAVTLPTVQGLMKGKTPHTVAAWVKVNALPSNRAWILLLGNEATGAHHWLINKTGVTQFGVWGGSQVSPSLPVGQWKHVAITFDGTTLTGYVNGVSIGSLSAAFNLQGTPLTLAKTHKGENYFNGVIDDVYVYNRALRVAEVAALAGASANPPPTVSLTAPLNGATYIAPAAITLSATAADTNGITKVEFYQGAVLLGTDTVAPYTWALSNVAIGTYSYTAKAYDSLAASTVSAASSVTVKAANTPPTVSLTAPLNSATYTAPAAITLSANAADTNDITKVEFYQGAVLLGTDTVAPYTWALSNVAIGTYSYTAKAYDSLAASTVSAPASVTVKAANHPPAITALTATPQTLLDTATSQLQVVASDPDAGPSPLNYIWSIVSGGGSLSSSTLTNPVYTPANVSAPTSAVIKVTVSDGAATASQNLTLTVNDTPVVATVTITYYHNDALGSPIAATGPTGNLLWRESYRPYGERLDNQPAGATNPIWYTGKRQDPETGLVYMGARYYNPALGRFLSIDPVGPDENNLHSLNRYAYANNNPYRFTDPDGNIPLETFWDAGNVVYDLGKAAYGAATNNPALVAQGLGDAAADTAAMLIPYVPAGSSKVARMATEKAGAAAKGGKNFADKQNRQQRLRDLVNDDKVSTADRGWIKQEMNEVAVGKKGHLRNPPGKDLAHERGRENAKGFGYEHANLQNRQDHRTQHKLDNWGRNNKER